MKKQFLNDNWRLTVLGSQGYDIKEKDIETCVPTSVYYTLLNKGLMPDPFYRDNELDAFDLMKNDFELKTSFTPSKDILKADKICLEFKGIDTVAHVYLNGQLLFDACNMHRTWEYDVTGLVKDGENDLLVHIDSPINYIKEEQEKCYTGGSGDATEGFPHLRKAHCMFGWDWGPRLPDAGIFRDVTLIGVEKARITDVYISQIHSEKKVELLIDTEEELVVGDIKIDSYGDAISELQTQVICTVTDPFGQVVYEGPAEDEIVIDAPCLWWPNGYGKQYLYTVEVALTDMATSDTLDVITKRIGLRTMSMSREHDEWGREFCHIVNGVKIFAMGADYIPEDNILPRITRERTEKLLKDAAWAHHNSIRVWGGGYYPDDYFYDICDELGLIVWQDFMFACASYELDDDFEANITEEIIDNVKRIRHHASLGLWCGNNEMETQTLDGCWKPSVKQKADYLKIFDYIIPKLLKELDPDRFYWPSSPSRGGNFDYPWDENDGDAHYWDVWHGNKPFTDFRKYYYRYLSEFGFQSFPALPTIESFTEPDDRNIFSYVMEMHQRNTSANGKIMNYMSATYRYPNSFESLIYASQLLQAEAIRYGVEHNRRHRGRCMGTVVWQLNDIWPVASWAGIDSFGRRKALHYAEKKMFAPVLVSAEENGDINQRPYCISEDRKVKYSFRLNVANETQQQVSDTLKWQIRDTEGQILFEGQKEITVAPLSVWWDEEVDLSGRIDPTRHYLSYSYGEGSGTVLFAAPKHFHFTDPGLTATIKGDAITVKAARYARKIEIITDDPDIKLSDNFFDLNAGEEKTVTIEEGRATSVRTRSVYSIGR